MYDNVFRQNNADYKWNKYLCLLFYILYHFSESRIFLAYIIVLKTSCLTSKLPMSELRIFSDMINLLFCLYMVFSAYIIVLKTSCRKIPFEYLSKRKMISVSYFAKKFRNSGIWNSLKKEGKGIKFFFSQILY